VYWGDVIDTLKGSQVEETKGEILEETRKGSEVRANPHAQEESVKYSSTKWYVMMLSIDVTSKMDSKRS